MYKLLIEDQTDISVEIKPNFGKTSFLYEALKSGSIDIYPEYTGTITTTLVTNPPTDLSNDPEQVYEAAARLSWNRMVWFICSQWTSKTPLLSR